MDTNLPSWRGRSLEFAALTWLPYLMQPAYVAYLHAGTGPLA